MMKLYYGLFFFSAIFLQANQQLSWQIGYEYTDFSFGFRNLSSFADIEENWENISSFVTNFDYLYAEQHVFYTKTTLFYTHPLSDHGSCLLTTNVPWEASNRFSYLVRGYTYGFEQRLGYPFRFGPLDCTPLLGLFFEELAWKRRNVHPATINNVTFSPQPRVRMRNTMPLVGVEFFYQPWQKRSFIMRSSYAYKFGSTRLRSYYQYNETSVDPKVERFSGIHQVELAALLRVSCHAHVGIDCSYSRQRAKEKFLTKGVFDGIRRQLLRIKLVTAFIF